MTLAKWLGENESILGAYLIAHSWWAHWHFQALLVVFYPWAEGDCAAVSPSAWGAVPGAAGAGRSGGRSAAAAPSLVTWAAFNPLAAYSGISSELSLFIQEHFRRKAPLCFAIYFDRQHPDL